MRRRSREVVTTTTMHEQEPTITEVAAATNDIRTKIDENAAELAQLKAEIDRLEREIAALERRTAALEEEMEVVLADE